MSLTAQCAIAMLAEYGITGVTIEQYFNQQYMSHDFAVVFRDGRPPCLVRIDCCAFPITEEDAMQITEAVLEHLTK